MRTRLIHIAAGTALCAVAFGCASSSTAGPQGVLAERSSSSATASRTRSNVPGIVQAFADSAGGDKLAVTTIAEPDFALVDHWNRGVAQTAIAQGGWESACSSKGRRRSRSIATRCECSLPASPPKRARSARVPRCIRCGPPSTGGRISPDRFSRTRSPRPM